MHSNPKEEKKEDKSSYSHRSDGEIKHLWNQLDVAIRKEDAKEITKLMTEVSEEEQARLLKITNIYKSNLLHLAACYGKTSFITLFDLFSTDIRNQALISKNQHGATVFYYAAIHQPDGAFRQLVEKTDAKIIEQALISKNNLGYTDLHFVAGNQLGNVFLFLIEKVDAKAINQAISVENSVSALAIAAVRQPGDTFHFFLKKINEKMLAQSLCLQGIDGSTVLQALACYPLSDSFAKLIEHCSAHVPLALNKTCHLYYQGKSVLELALPYQPPNAIAQLLNAIDDDTLKAMFKVPTIPPALLAGIAGYLGHERSFQTQPLVGRLFALAGPQLAEYCAKLWLAGKVLPDTVTTAAIPHFKTLIQTKPQRASELEAIAGYFKEEKKAESKEGEALELKEDGKSCAILWKQGLHSLYEYHLLKKRFPDGLLAQTADDLYRAGLLFKGCGLSFEPPVINSKLAEANAKGEVLLKIIKPKDWPEFKRQIGDYNYRADLRDKKQDKSKAQDKYVHLKGQTLSEMKIGYNYNKEKKKDHPYEHTIKQSVSLLSKNYDTAVFGEHDPKRPLVGLLFSKEHSIIKAMLLKDLGTFGRKWVGSKEEVAAYAKEMEKINVTDFKTFKEEIEKNPQRLNEVLAKLSREAMLGVVFVTDTPEARKQARAYHADIKKAKHAIDLPIYFYDRTLRAMRLYTPREQQDDIYAEQYGLPGYNSICEGEKKLRYGPLMIELQQKLSNIPDDKKEFIALLEFYKVVEENKPREPKNLWHRFWQLGEISSEANQLAAQKIIDLLNNKELQAPITEQDFDALKTGDLGKIMNAMRGKNILPDEFLKQERNYAISVRKL